MDVEDKVIICGNNKYLVVKTLFVGQDQFVFLINLDNQNDSFFAKISDDEFLKVDDVILKEKLLELIAREQ